MTAQYNVIIIGAGPAGSFLARNLKEYSVGSVLVVDKRLNASGLIFNKEKPCSGLVAVPAQPFLHDILEESQETVYATPKSLQVRVVDAQKKRYVLTKDIVYNINRVAMENVLVSNIPKHIDVLYGGAFVGYTEKVNGEIDVMIKVGNEIKTFSTKILVGADGAKSKIRRLLADGNDTIEKYTGVEWFIKCPDRTPASFNIIIDKNLTDYYLWAFPKNNHLLVGGVFNGLRNLQTVPPELLKHIQELGIIGVSDCIEVEKVWAHPILRPLGTNALYCGNKRNIYLIGEAAGYICPTSAEGYSYAFGSAEALAKFLNGKKKSSYDYRSTVRVMKKMVRSKIIYNSFIRGIFMVIFGKSY